MNITPVNQIRNYSIKNASDSKSMSEPLVSNTNTSDSISFKKGKKVGKITEFFANFYGKHFVNSDAIYKFSKKMHDMNCGNVTQHLQTLGSIITSSVYMKKTLSNESLDKDRRKTLAWNQGLVLGVSTLGAYTLSNVMGDMNKKLEYKYVALQEQKMAKLGKEVDPKKIAEMREVFTKRLKGFRTLLPIMTFTLIYRYISPVAITPVANWVSSKFSSADKKEKGVESKAENKDTAIVEEDKSLKKVA